MTGGTSPGGNVPKAHRGAGTKRPRKKVVWDEGNLAHLEETKTPKQKITEPKTPYHTLSMDSEDACGLSPMNLPSDNESAPQLNPEQVTDALNAVAGKRERGGWTSSEDEGDAGEFEKWMEDRAAAAQSGGEGTSVTFQGTSDYYGAGAMNVKEFKEHRKRHYDEFRKLKQLRAQGRKVLDEEEGEDKTEGAGASADGDTPRGAGSGRESEGYMGGAESDGEKSGQENCH